MSKLEDAPLLILSENPIEQIWTHLSLWESRELAKKLLAERATDQESELSDEQLKAKALALSYCLRNARENIRSVQVSTTLEIVANYYG
jgi:hypothetical protein